MQSNETIEREAHFAALVEDGRRFRKLAAMLACADFYYLKERDGGGEIALIFALPSGSAVSADLRRTLDGIEHSSKDSAK